MVSDAEDSAIGAADVRGAVRALWAELERSAGDRRYANLEGGSIDQHRNGRLRLHHCANYAAVLALTCHRARQRLELLELGCGSGVLSHALGRVMPRDWFLTATDYSSRLIERAAKSYSTEHLGFERLDVRELGAGGLDRYDIVFALEMLEHLGVGETQGLLHGLHAGMRPGATLILSTPDRSPFRRAHSGYAPHRVEYTFDSLRRLCSDSRICPFRKFAIHRLTSRRITAEAVSSEKHGGHLLNRSHGLLLSLAGRQRLLRGLYQGTISVLYRVYAAIPFGRGFDVDGYLETIDLLPAGQAGCGSSSFSLVAEFVR